MKRVIALLLAVMMLAALASCGKIGDSAGIGSSSVYGENFDQPWSVYDDLIAKIKTEADSAKRTAYMYEAEKMLQDTGSVMPLYYYTNPYLVKTFVKDYIYSTLGWVSFKYAYLEGQDKQEFAGCFASEPEHMDPALNASVDGSIYLTNLFSGLYGYETGADGKTVVVADCAKEIVKPTALDGGKYQYVITLKDGLKWSDGTPMKASDFTYAWNRAVDPETLSDYQYIFDVIDGYSDETPKLNISADDANGTITVVTAAYCAYFDQLLAFPTYYPVRQDVVEAGEGTEGWTVTNYVSNGAFRLVSHTVNSEIVCEKNPNYWNADKVKLDKLTFFLSDDDDAILANYENGVYMYTTTIAPAKIAEFKADPKRMNVDFFIGDYIGTYYLEFNVNMSFAPGISKVSDSKTAWENWTPKQNAEVKKALSMLIDRNYIVEKVTLAGQQPAYGFVPAGMSDGSGSIFRENAPKWWSVDPADKDASIQSALEILKQYYTFDDATGKFTNFPTFEYSVNPTTGNLAIATAIQDMWKEYGINVTTDNRAWATIQTALTQGDFTMSRLGWIADYDDPVNFLEIFLTASGNNHPHFGK